MLDEYALILHLSDVYWEEDGRSSVEAVFAAVAVAGLLIMGLHPLMFLFPVARDTASSAWHVAVVGALVMTLPLAMGVVLKGKVWTGLLGMFIVVLLVIGAIRLSRPHAPWARWRYTTAPDKMRRALQRERRWRRPVVQAKLLGADPTAADHRRRHRPHLPARRAAGGRVDDAADRRPDADHHR